MPNYKPVYNVVACRVQTLRDNNLMKEGDWMTKKEALRENLPAHFTDEDIRVKLQDVSSGVLAYR